MKLIWGTDFHFNFLRNDFAVRKFGEYLSKEYPDNTGIIITGDISDGTHIVNHLKEFSSSFTNPIYFVLGNHSYYDASWSKIDSLVTKIVDEIPHLYWLNQGIHEVCGHVICGVCGWYDAYHGNSNSNVELNDFYNIAELLPQSRYRPLLLEEIRRRAGFEADTLARHLKEACKTDNEVIIVGTHIPPYAESAWHNGKTSDREWVPWFSSASTGATLDRFAEHNPDKKFIVLTGHSHGSGIYQRRDNMTVYTGPAVYGFPNVSGWINTKERKIQAYGPSGEKVEHKY
jgi:predicted phosphohydrolase